MQKKNIQHIVPAILPKSYEDLVSHLDMVAHTVPYVQIDVVDGHFAPNKTWPFAGADIGKFITFVNQEEGLPYWEEIDFEIDLMVSDPSFVADQWIAAGANRVVIHAKSLDRHAFIDLVKKTTEKGVEVVVGVEKSTLDIAKGFIDAVLQIEDSLTTPFDAVFTHKKSMISGIQCMGIDKIGFQHNPFNPEVIPMIKELRQQYPNLAISVDGGVSFDNAKALFDAGATRLVVGSTIFEDELPNEAIEELEELYKV